MDKLYRFIWIPIFAGALIVAAGWVLVGYAFYILVSSACQ